MSEVLQIIHRSLTKQARKILLLQLHFFPGIFEAVTQNIHLVHGMMQDWNTNPCHPFSWIYTRDQSSLLARITPCPWDKIIHGGGGIIYPRMTN